MILGDGTLFPTISSPDVFFVTLVKTSGLEIVKVTARSGDVFTIVRAQEGTTAKAFSQGDKVQMFITAGHLEDLRDNSLRIDNIPTTLITGLNADRLDGIQASDFFLNTGNINILDPKVLNFGSGYRENVIINQQYGNAFDPYWPNVSLLLPMTGINESQSFTDYSSKSNGITAVGSAKISTNQSKFGGSSAYFDGSSGWLTTPGSSNLSFGTGDFTVECWVYCLNVSRSYLYIIGTDTAGSWQIAINGNTGGKIGIARHTIAWDAEYTHGLSNNTWTHIAVVRSSGTLGFYVNGTSVGSASNSIAYNSGTTLFVGGHASLSNCAFYGYIDDLRITKGIARYTGNFTVPTIANPISGFTDTIYDPYYLNTILLLHCNGTTGSTTFTDSSILSNSVSVAGDAKLSTTQQKFGTTSAYFDGTGDYLALSSALLSSEDYTIECWIYLNSYSSDASWGRYIYSQYEFGVDFNNRMLFGLQENGSKKLYTFRNGDGAIYSTSDIPLNTWTHVAVVRSGSNKYLFVNGVLEVSGSATGSLSTAISRIGCCVYGSTLGFWDGYIDELRITKGVARYTSSFTVPSYPFADISNLTVDPYIDSVSLLMHFNSYNSSASFIDSSPNSNVITRYGDAKISTDQSKFGSSSAYFDGTGDYLTVPASSSFAFGTGDFTIECWVYAISHGSRITNRTDGGTPRSLGI